MDFVTRTPEVIGWGRKTELTADVQKARDAANADPRDPMKWLAYGNALCGMHLYRNAIEAYSKGIAANPTCGELYRERAHRYVNLWQFAEAEADSVKAAPLLPEDWSVWYHYTLAMYFQGDYHKAEETSRQLLRVCKEEWQTVPPLAWLWRSLMMQGKKEEASEVVRSVTPQIAHIDWHEDYYDCLMMYKGLVTPEELTAKVKRTIDDPVFKVCIYAYTVAYGIANYYYLHGNMERYHEMLEFELSYAGKNDTTFGFAGCAAEKALDL